MIVVQPTILVHEIRIVPRLYPFGDLLLSLYNEATKVTESLDNNYIVQDGYLYVSFEKVFNKSDKYKITIKEANEVIYRGKIKATSQEPQEYQQTKDKYYYE
jgi:hypothetical protein